MTAFIVIISIFAVAFAFATSIRSIDWNNMQFSDGALVGCAFFIVTPLTIIAIDGQLNGGMLRIPPYSPINDIVVTANILMGSITVLVFFWTEKLIGANKKNIPISNDFRKADFYLFIAIYLTLALTSFMLSGRSQGGHWMKGMEQAFATDTRFIVIANFANVFRAATFGLLIYATNKSIISKRNAIAIGGALALFDTLVTFNRITMAYWAVSSLIIMRSYFLYTAPAILIAAPITSYVSRFWSTFRALALNDGLTVSGINKAFILTSSAHSNTQAEISSIINNIFEASNLLVFSWIIKAVPERLSPLWGETMIVRPFAVFIPSTLWSEKPPVFGVRLGDQIQGVHGLSLNSTLMGEAYANFYIFWPIALFAALALINWLFKTLSKRSRTYGFLGFMIAFALWRFDYSFAAISLVALLSFEFLRTLLKSNVRVGKFQ